MPDDLLDAPLARRVAQRAAGLAERVEQLDGALELLDAAIKVYVADFSPNVRPLAAVRARLLIARGELLAAALEIGFRRGGFED